MIFFDFTHHKIDNYCNGVHSKKKDGSQAKEMFLYGVVGYSMHYQKRDKRHFYYLNKFWIRNHAILRIQSIASTNSIANSKKDPTIPNGDPKMHASIKRSSEPITLPVALARSGVEKHDWIAFIS